MIVLSNSENGISLDWAFTQSELVKSYSNFAKIGPFFFYVGLNPEDLTSVELTN